jgi:hypothetical protein
MGITFGDYLIDSGYYEITPEQERERDMSNESLLRLADNIAAHGSSITYPSRGAAQEVRNVVRELAAVLRAADAPLPQSAREALQKCEAIAEENKLHWARKVDPCRPYDPSREIYRAKSAACFQIEMDIRALAAPSSPAHDDLVSFTPDPEIIARATSAEHIETHKRITEAVFEVMRRNDAYIEPDTQEAITDAIWAALSRPERGKD